jgi:hypothetical protein
MTGLLSMFFLPYSIPSFAQRFPQDLAVDRPPLQ